MTCDIGRSAQVLEWVLATGIDDHGDLSEGRIRAQAGVAANNANEIGKGVGIACGSRDFGSYNAVMECVRENPTAVVEKGREIMKRHFG